MFQIGLQFFSLIYECDKLIYSPLPQQTLAGRRAKKCGKRKKAEEHVFLCHVFRYSWLVEKRPQIFFRLYLIGWKATRDFFWSDRTDPRQWLDLTRDYEFDHVVLNKKVLLVGTAS